MDNRNSYPAPLRQKLILTCLVGAACLLVGFAVFLFLKDQTALFLSLAILCMCLGSAISYHRIMVDHAYEVVEGTCVAISPKPLRKYRNVQIIDDSGIESNLLLAKHARIKIGYRYRFYFKNTERLTIGKEHFDAALSSDSFLGFEEIGRFTETQPQKNEGGY